MLDDEQFGRRLGDQLRHETAGVHADPNLIAALRRRQVRRTRTVRAAVATTTAAVAAITVTVTMAGRSAPAGSEQTAGPTSSGTAPSSTVEVPVLNAAQVRAATIEALGKASDYVIFSKTTYDSGYYDTWLDKSTNRYRNDVYTTLPAATEGGRRMPDPHNPPRGPMRLSQSHAASGPRTNRETISVDYDGKWWSVSHDTDAPGSAIGLDVTDQESVRAAISNGTAELLGHEDVNGIDTLHLRVIGQKLEFRLDLWVDSKSYLPIKDDLVKGDGSGEFKPSHNVATTYKWLPKTEENLRFLTLTPPADFKKIK
jgi:hypothetical protein